MIHMASRRYYELCSSYGTLLEQFGAEMLKSPRCKGSQHEAVMGRQGYCHNTTSEQ